MAITLSSNPSFELPPDIHQLIDESLVLPEPDDPAYGGDAWKYFVEGHPDLLVRSTPERFTSYALRQSTGLGEFGITMLPYHVVEHDGEEWVVTKRVDGVDLETALASEQHGSTGLFAEADLVWSGLVANIRVARESGSNIITDIEGPWQYMFGSIDWVGHDKPTIHLVDLPQFVWSMQDTELFTDTAAGMANGIVAIEQAANGVAERSRQEFDRLLQDADVRWSWHRKVLTACRYILETGTPLHVPDNQDRVNQMPEYRAPA